MASQTTLEEISETIDRTALHRPSAGLRNFLLLLPEEKRLSDRRKTTRFTLIADVIVVPLDKDFRPLAEPFVACSLNVSAGGLCFYHAEPIDSTLLYVEISSSGAPNMSARMRVLRQRPVGDYFEIAGQFLTDGLVLSDGPPNGDADSANRFTVESVRHRATSEDGAASDECAGP
jgi:hypothetical protein